MRKVACIPLVVLLLTGLLASCGSGKQQDNSISFFKNPYPWSTTFYTEHWEAGIRNCKNQKNTYVHSIDENPDPSAQVFTEGQSKFTFQERAVLMSTEWFTRSDWSEHDGYYGGAFTFRQTHWRHRPFQWGDSDSNGKSELLYNACYKRIRDAGIQPEEMYRCIWDHTESMHSEKDWRYYSQELKNQYSRDAINHCEAKYPPLSDS